MQHINIVVKGKVQGVFFRASTVDKARELNLRGTVRNRVDGSVYIEVEGEEKPLNELIKWCANGPPMARVSEVMTSEGDLKDFNTFEVVRD